jgi:hypothetical protein
MLGFLHKFPYSNFHELNLDWLISTVKSFSGTIDQMQDQIDEAEAYMKDNIESTTIEVINQAIRDGSYNVAVQYTAADEKLDIIVTEA